MFRKAEDEEIHGSEEDLDEIIASRQTRVVWTLAGASGGKPLYCITQFPLNFDEDAIEFWWPQLRDYDDPVLIRENDGSWQEFAAENRINIRRGLRHFLKEDGSVESTTSTW